MSLSKTAHIEMAPGHEWQEFSGEAGAVLLPPGSDLLDSTPLISALVAGDLGFYDTVAASVPFDSGGEGNIFALASEQGSLALKVPLENDAGNEAFSLPILRMARYGGVCIEKSVTNLEFRGARVVTPRYEAVIRTEDFEGVVMTRENKLTLHQLVVRNLCEGSTRLKIQENLAYVIFRSLVDGGLPGSIEPLLDVTDRNIMMGVTDGEIDWSEIAIVDALKTYPEAYMHNPEKLWHVETGAI